MPLPTRVKYRVSLLFFLDRRALFCFPFVERTGVFMGVVEVSSSAPFCSFDLWVAGSLSFLSEVPLPWLVLPRFDRGTYSREDDRRLKNDSCCFRFTFLGFPLSQGFVLVAKDVDSLRWRMPLALMSLLTRAFRCNTHPT